MARCKAVHKSTATKQVLLVCDLDAGHELAHPKHFDKKEMVTWNNVSNEPTPVESTRTSPKSPGSVTKSVAAHTRSFDVVTV